jgi:hypothetical protein
MVKFSRSCARSVPRDAAPEELVGTVLAVSRGEAHLPPWLQGGLLNELDRVRHDVLEPNGFTLSGVSMLAYSTSTVKNVFSGLMARYGLNSRAHAVAFALRAGVI